MSESPDVMLGGPGIVAASRTSATASRLSAVSLAPGPYAIRNAAIPGEHPPWSAPPPSPMWVVGPPPDQRRTTTEPTGGEGPVVVMTPPPRVRIRPALPQAIE